MMKKFEKELSIIQSDPVLIVTLPIAFSILIILHLIKKFVLIRFGFLHSDRIGHFAANTELYFCEEKKFIKKKNKIYDFYYFPTKPCNKQLAKMIKRKKTVAPKLFVRPFCLITRRLKYFKDHITGRSSAGDYDIYNLLDKYPAQLKFTKKEEIKGTKNLEKMGIKSKFVCLIVRDSSYLKKNFPKSNFSYHDHRDDKIERYEKAVNFLIRKGYYVLRMGSITKNKLKIKSERFIDYSNSKYKSDFMDIFLGAKCYFCISNNTGYDAVPLIFRRPILHIDSIPIGCISTFSKNIYNTILCHYLIKKRRKLKMSEIFKMNLAYAFRNHNFRKKGIKLIKMTPTEIKNSVSEVLNSIIIKNQKQTHFQRKFVKNYEKNIKTYNSSNKYHGKIKSIFLNTFIKKNLDLLQ